MTEGTIIFPLLLNLVLPPGLEPGRPKATDFKSGVSTYSTMRANWPALQDSNLRPTA